tara:strand:- start:195 stop:569 length:375 start_codon:yes stop_codon:yes gene_type:complete
MSDRKFGFVFAIALTVLCGFLWLIFGTLFRGLPITAAVFVSFALIAPGVLLPFNRIWMAVAGRLGTANNFLILGIVYFLVILPVGLFMRVIGRDLMHRKKDRTAESYLTPVGRQTDSETMRDIF